MLAKTIYRTTHFFPCLKTSEQPPPSPMSAGKWTPSSFLFCLFLFSPVSRRSQPPANSEDPPASLFLPAFFLPSPKRFCPKPGPETWQCLFEGTRSGKEFSKQKVVQASRMSKEPEGSQPPTPCTLRIPELAGAQP